MGSSTWILFYYYAINIISLRVNDLEIQSVALQW
jgi:hypothetical protein